MEKKKSKKENTTFKKISEDILLYGLSYGMTLEQRNFADNIYNDEKLIVFCNARAGTGKTTVAVAVAKLLCQEKRYDGLVYIFSPVEDDKMGFRPGTQNEKEAAYLTPLKDALCEVGDMPEKSIICSDPDEKQAKYEKNGWVEAKSHTFIRGTNLKNKVNT